MLFEGRMLAGIYNKEDGVWQWKMDAIAELNTGNNITVEQFDEATTEVATAFRSRFRF